MRHKESNPYFKLQRGFKVNQSQIKAEASYTMAAVSALKEQGEIIGQHVLPGFGEPDDIQLWMPERMQETERILQTKLAKIRAELKAIEWGNDFDHTLYDPKIPIEMVPNCEYPLNQNG